MKNIVCLALGFFTLLAFFSCTYSVNMVHNHGTASDVIDEDQSPVNDVKPQVTITPKI